MKVKVAAELHGFAMQGASEIRRTKMGFCLVAA